MADTDFSPEAGLSLTDPVLALEIANPPPGELSKALGRGARRMVEQAARTAEAGAREIGLDTISGWLDKKATEFDKSANQPYLAPRVVDATEAVDSFGNTADYITSLVGEQIPNFGAQVASSLLGFGAARALGAAGRTGAVVGAAAPSFIQNFGDNMSEQNQAGVYEPSIALGAAGLQTALDTVLFSSIAQRVGGKVSADTLRKGKAKLAHDIITGAGIEGVTEGVQEGISVLARTAIDPNYPERRDEIMSRILNAVVGGGILGAGFGGVSGVLSSNRPAQLPPEAPAPQPIVSNSETIGAKIAPIVSIPDAEPFPALLSGEPSVPPEITRGGAQTFQGSVALPDAFPAASIGPIQIPEAPNRSLRTGAQLEAHAETIAQAFGVPVPDRKRTRIVAPTILGSPVVSDPLDVTRAFAEMKRDEGQLLTSAEIRSLRGAAPDPLVVETARTPRDKGGPEAERTAQGFITDRVDEAASTVLSALVGKKAISTGTSNNIRRMIKSRMAEVYSKTAEDRGPKFDAVIEDVVKKTPLRADARAFIDDLRAEIARQPEKNQLPAGARDFVVSDKPFPRVQRSPWSHDFLPRIPMDLTGGPQILLFGGNEQAAQAVTRQVATKKGKPLAETAVEQMKLFSKAAMNLDVAGVAANHNKYGGSSTDPVSGAELAGSKGFSVSALADRELIINGDLTAEQVAEYAHANSDALSVPGAVLGTWKNPDTGQSHLDVSVISQTLDDAMKIALESNQLAIWDMRLGVNIPVGHPLMNLAQVYNAQVGLPPRQRVDYAEVDASLATEMANAYANAKDDPENPEVQSAYTAMNAEVKAQYDLVSKTISIEPWIGSEQPYANAADLRKDVFENNHIFIWQGGQQNSLMTNEENFRHRAVHDLFGHAPTGFEFSPRGEWNAFRVHAQMFTPPALRAFVSESIAQVAYANYHKDNLGKSLTERTFGVQKAVLIPDSLWQRVSNAPLDAQSTVVYDFQTKLSKLGEEATDYLTKIVGDRPGLTLKLQMNGTQYAGRFSKSGQKSMIELALSAKDVLSTAAHEGFHLLETEVLSEAERRVVASELKSGTRIYERLLAAAKAYDLANKTSITSEIIENPLEARAYGFEFWRKGQLEATGILARAFEKIAAVLKKVASFFNGKPYASMTDIFESIERGDYSTKRRLKAEASNIAEDEWSTSVEPDILPGADLIMNKTTSSRARGRPWWVQNSGNVRRMRNELTALAMEGVRGRTWHRRSAEAAMVFARGNRDAAERVAALFANYSPQQRVGFDARSAMVAIMKHSQGLPITGTGARYPQRMDAQAQLILDGKSDATGIKRESFFWNMMKYINPEKYPEATQRATIDMWMAIAFGHDHLAVTDPEYMYADAEVKRLARQLGWGVDETQAAVWISIKARMDPLPVRRRTKEIAEKRGWMEDQEVLGKTVRGVKKENNREYMALWRRIGMSIQESPALDQEIDGANYAYDSALRDLVTGKINIGGTSAQVTEEDVAGIGLNLEEVRTNVKPPLARGDTLDLFSRAAMIDLEDKLRRGEFDKVAVMRAMQELTSIAGPAESKVARMLGIPSEAKYKAGDVLGVFGRAYNTWLSSGEYRATQSGGYKNVHNVLTFFDQRKKRLISTAVDERLSKWRAGSAADIDVVSKALLERTMGAFTADSDGYFNLLHGLSPEQRLLFKQATDMIATELDAELAADMKVYGRVLGTDSPEYAEWVEARTTHVEDLKASGYFPERRYGDHAVNMFVVTPEGKKITIGFESYDSASQAKLRINGTSRVSGLKSTLAEFPAVGVEYAYRYKPDLDGSVSFQKVMELLDANGVEVTQAERERLAKALIAADSTRRNRIFRRENVPGASVDGLRVLSELAVSNSTKIAYSEFGDAIQKSRKGNAVTVAFDQQGAPVISVDEEIDLWNSDSLESAGFYRRLADKRVNQVLQPDNNRLTSGLRALASLQFLGGSIAAAGVQLTSLPMNTIPWLTQHTSYADASAKVYGALSNVVGTNGKVFMQFEPSKILTSLQDLSLEMPGVDEVPGLRQSMIIAFQDGTTMDTDIYEIMGLARGQILSLPRSVQKLADAWMLPFRKAEQANRWATYIASYKIGQKKGLTGAVLREFSRKAVDATQFRYDSVNRPSLANTPIGSLVMTFKSYPIYMSELIVGLAKTDRKAALVMLGTLWFFAGLEGMPFFEDAEDLVDTLAQRIFGSPFNSQRFLRNLIADASEVVPFLPNADILLRGSVNFLSDANVAGRVGLGNILPGTRMFAADADYKRTAEEIVGPTLSAVTGWATFAGAMSQGDMEDAFRKAPFLAVQNAAKGYTAFSKGYYADGRGQKLVDAGPIGTFLQGVGFSSESVRQAYETANIDRRTNAFYTEYKAGLTKELVVGLRDADQTKVQEVVELTSRWNETYPNMPILLSSASVRRAVALAGMTLSERTLALLPKQLRYGSATYEPQ